MDALQAFGEGPIVVVAVDDNAADLELLDAAFSRLKAGTVELTGFQDPDQALQSLVHREPDVLFVDHSLGTRTGLEFLESARLLGVSAPAILLTGNGDEELAVTALHSGFADYLSKGVMSEKSLRRSIHNVLEKQRLKLQATTYRRELESTVEVLGAKNREISSFYHTLAHELKTPLTGAREYVSIVQDGLMGPVNPEQDELLASAMNSCDQLRRCIDDLFDVSRMETGKFQVERTPGRLDEVVRQGFQCLAPKAEQLGIELVLEAVDALPVIALDQQRILQVVTNLVGNAIKFTEPGGRVAVSCTHQTDGFQRVSVRDTGAGISAKDLRQVFERLFQAQGNAAIKGGMGLGLHLCRELVRLHGGDIMAESVLGKGSTFAFTLPGCCP